MKFQLAILLALICHISHGMEKTEQTKKKKHCHHPLYEWMLFCYKNKKIFPQEILYYLFSYYVNLTNKNLEKSTDPFIQKWQDYRIPQKYYYTLSSKQLTLLDELFDSQSMGHTPSNDIYYKLSPKQHHLLDELFDSQSMGYIPSNNIYVPKIDFFLKSEKKYKYFLSLPQEVRKCLTFLPQSIITAYNESHKEQPLKNISINFHQTIQVKTTKAKAASVFGLTCNHSDFYDSIPKPMLPEEEKYKKLLDKNTR